MTENENGKKEKPEKGDNRPTPEEPTPEEKVTTGPPQKGGGG